MSATTNHIEALAAAAANTRWPDLPKQVQDQCVDLILDTVAVMAAGTTHPSHLPFAASSVSQGDCTRFDGSEGCSAQTAAYVNGAATTVWQLQDGHRMAKGHPASHLCPALIAVAEERGATGIQVLSAFVAGYEIGARIGLAMRGIHPALHDAGTWSSIGAAAAVAHLASDGDRACIQRAIACSASTAAMFDNETVTQGATSHHLYIGLAAQQAVAVGTAAANGLTGLSDALQRYFGPRAGRDFDETRLSDGIDQTNRWDRYEVLNAYFKVHPTCAHLHGVNDAILWLMGHEPIQPEDIEHVQIATYQAALVYDVDTPTCDLSLRFSAAATTAVALVFRKLDIDSLSFETFSSADVQEVFGKITTVHDPALDQFYPEGRPARVKITCKDGRIMEKEVVHPLGDCTNPLDRRGRHEKAINLLGRRYPGKGEAIAQHVLNLDTHRSFSSFGELLR